MDEPTEKSLPRVAASPLIGHVLDSRYEIFEQVGGGDIAHVCRAWDRRVQRIVAVKVLDRHFADDPDLIRSFAREARQIAGLPIHRNIVTVHHVGHDGIVPYVVMQFVAHGSLKQLMTGEAPLDAGRAFAICQQIARGLEFAHQYGIIHGNLKPANVLISNGDEVKLTDFGVTHSGKTGNIGASNGRAVHSPYLSPEQELGKAPDARSDIYALGVILYEMVAGCLPFGEETSPSLKHALERAPDPNQINPELPPAAAAIVMQALEREPDHRYQSAAAFAAALHRYLVLDRGDTPRYSLGPEEPPQPGQSGARPIEKPQKQNGRKSRAEQDDIMHLRPVQRRRPPLMSLLYLITVAIAAAGGWFTYGALSRALNGSSSGSGQNARPTPRPTAHVSSQRQGRSRRVVAPPRRSAIPGACPVHSVGPVRLVRIWAEATGVHPGGAITFEYTVANNAPQCRDVLLGLTAVSDVRPGLTLADRRADKVVGAMPGTHLYKRQFTFPPSVAGQRFDILWSVADPSGAHVYGSTRVNGLITVSPS